MFYNKKLTATRLKELRLEKGYTMQEVAKKIDIKNRSNIYEIEHAKSGLNIDRAFKFSDLYNVSLDYIYGLSNNKDNKNLINTNELDAVLEFGVTYNGKSLTNTDIIALKAFLQGLTSDK